MVRLLAVLVLAGAWVNAQTITQTFGTGANAFSIDFVEIGNPGNNSDTTGYGSISYTYNIGKYEINREAIDKVNALGGTGISYDSNWTTSNNKPATGISWNEAALFVNFLNVSRGYQAAYNFSSGFSSNISIWNDGEYKAANPFRHKDAVYFLPSEDEWYKAAFFNPTSNVYSKFANGLNTPPIPILEGTDPNTARYNQLENIGPADIDNAGGLSSYGTMAQNGNVWEWTESAWDGNNDNGGEDRVVLGGNKNDLANVLEAGYRSYKPVWSDGTDGVEGFRVAMVPEPSSLSLLLAGGAVLMAGRRRESD